MNDSSSTPPQEGPIKNDINKILEVTIDKQNKITEKSTKPLIRYFDIIEDTTASYVLGYN